MDTAESIATTRARPSVGPTAGTVGAVGRVGDRPGPALRPSPGAPRPARVARHLHHPRGGGRVRAPGPALQRRQGLGRPPAPGGQGLCAREDALPGAPRRHRAQLPRGPRVPRRPGRHRRGPPPGGQGAGLHRPGPRGRPRSGGLAQSTADHDAAGRHQRQQVRRRLRRGPARRGQGPGQGAGALLPRLVRPVGPQAATPRTVAALPGQRAAGRAPARLPALGLHRARHLAVHPP